MYAEALVAVTKQQRVTTKAGNKRIKRPRMETQFSLISSFGVRDSKYESRANT
jgi:hypothetical protein